MIMEKSLVLTWALFLMIGSAAGQGVPPPNKWQFPLDLTFFNHAVAMPSDGIILSPLHPGFSLGTEYAYAEGRRGRLFQGLAAGYYYNKFNAKALFLQTSAGYRYTLGLGLFGDVAAGLGYLHSFHPRPIYGLNAQGEFERATDAGKGALMVLAAVGIGYDFRRKIGWPVSVFLRYQPYIQTPYNLESSVAPQMMFHFGIRVKFW
jgi:hypothetical protein